MASTKIIQKIKESAQFVAQNAKDVKINREKLEEFANQLNAEQLGERPPVGFPLKFSSIEEEINLISLLDLLNFGSGYRKELHEANQRGASETITFGVLGMFISGKQLDAEVLEKMSILEVAEYFQIPLKKAQELQPGLSTYVDAPSKQLATYITTVLNETGKILRSRQMKDLAHFVLHYAIKEEATASHLVDRLVTTFPGFADTAVYNGQTVYIVKKAQLLAADLYRTYKDQDPRFNFPDVQNLTIFSDNVIPAVLRKMGILELSDELSQHIDSAKPLPAGNSEVELRCVAIEAAEQIVKYLKEHKPSANITAANLDYYFWKIGKEKEYRSVERHYTQNTFYY